MIYPFFKKCWLWALLLAIGITLPTGYSAEFPNHRSFQRIIAALPIRSKYERFRKSFLPAFLGLSGMEISPRNFFKEVFFQLNKLLMIQIANQLGTGLSSITPSEQLKLTRKYLEDDLEALSDFIPKLVFELFGDEEVRKFSALWDNKKVEVFLIPGPARPVHLGFTLKF